MYLPAVNLRWPLMMGNMGQPQCGAGGGGGHIPTSLHGHTGGLPGPSNVGGSGSAGLPSNPGPQQATTSTASAFKSVPSSSSCPNGVTGSGSGGAPCRRDQAPTTPPHPAPGLHSAPGPGAQHAQNAAVAAAAAAAAAATQLQGFCAPGGGGGIYSGGMDERTAAMMIGLKEAGGGGGGGVGGGGHYNPPVSAAASPHLTHPAFPMSVPMWFNPTQTAYSLFLGGEKALAASQYLAATDPFAKAAAANPFFELARMGHYPLGKKLFGCPQCRYITDRKNNLKRHVATMHQECDKSLECCGVVFKNKASLRDHVLIFHSNGYMCRFCGRNFCRKALLKRHLTVHSGQKDYLCSQCDYATSHKSNLERHKKVHNPQPTDSEDNDLDGSPSKDESPHCTSTTPSFSVASLFSPQHHPRISGSTSDSADAERMSRDLSPTGSIVRTVHAHSTTSEQPLSSERERPLVGGLGNNNNLTLPRFGHHHSKRYDDLPLSPIDVEEDANASEQPLSSERERPLVGGLGNNNSLTLPRFGQHHSNHEDDLDLNVLKPPRELVERQHLYAGDKLVHEDDLPLSPIDVEEDANTLIDVAN